MIIHVMGQISYKSGCLEVVIEDMKEWKNSEIVNEMVGEIINVHKRYKFAARSPVNAEEYIKTNLYQIDKLDVNGDYNGNKRTGSPNIQ